MRESLMTYRSEWVRFREYVWKARWWILASSALFLCVYLPWLFAPELHIDLDAYIMNPGNRWGGTDNGRQGFTLVNILLGLEKINPVFGCIFGFLLFCAVGVALGFFCYRFGMKGSAFCAVFGLLTFVAPIFVEQFYWFYRMIPQAVAYLFSVAAVGMMYYAILKKNALSCVLSVVLSTFVFSVHQVFVPTELSLIIIAFLLLYRRQSLDKHRNDIGYFSFVIKAAVLFVLSYVINMVITNKWFMTDPGFVGAFVQWGQVPVAQCLESILYGIIRNVFGIRSVHTTCLYFILAALGFVGTVIECIRAKGIRFRVLYVLAFCALQVCPFLISFYQGRESEIHSQLVYPLVLAFDAIFLSNLLISRKDGVTKMIRAGSFVLAAVLFWTQAQVVLRMIYTDQMRIEEDKRVAAGIERAFDVVTDGDSKPVIFIGRYIDELNPSCVRGDYAGVSVLGWDRGVLPHYMPGSTRTAQLLNTLGMDFKAVTDENAAIEARKKALDMPSWPADESVFDAGGCVVVKLSEDEWPEDVMVPSVKTVDNLEMSVGTGVSVVIDGVDESGENLVIKGWIDQPDNEKRSWKPHLCLLGEEGTYELTTVKTGREALSINGEPCINNGFTAMGRLADVPEPLEDCSVVFVYEDTAADTKSLCVPAVTVDTSLGGKKAGLPEEGETEKIDLPTYNGYQYGVPVSLDGDGGVISNGSSGMVIYGPYSPTDEGVYDITARFSVLSYTDKSEGTFDVALDMQSYVQSSFRAEDTSVTLEDVKMEPGHALETRVWVPEGMVIQIHSIEYERVG